MPRKSQASQAHLKNLQQSRKASVEDCLDSDAEESDYLPPHHHQSQPSCLEDFFLVLEEEGLACDSSDSDSDLDEDEEAEIRDEAVLLHFTSTLQKAQEVAAAAERKAWEMKKRPKWYDGQSARTVRRQEAKRRQIVVDGKQPFIRLFFQPKEADDACIDPEGHEDTDSDSSSHSVCKVRVSVPEN